MAKPKNILFIMSDQLRWDYLSCYGHPHLDTVNIDKLAERGVRFDRAYVQSPICGPSRSSCYTGRYMFTNGRKWHRDPLKISEVGMGEYLRAEGMRTVLVGKSHHVTDYEGLSRLGVDLTRESDRSIEQGGFESFERDFGVHPTEWVSPTLRYNEYLRELGYDTENPWHDNANSVKDENGDVLSGWFMRHAHLPANIKEEHSETPYMTNRAMEFLDEVGDDPWCLHLSYIKPHWPYIAPTPYHDMYTTEQILPVNRSDEERQDAHPIYDSFMHMHHSKTFSRDEVREKVVPVYMGLVKQIDDQIGRLMTYLEEKGLMDNTMIVFTSDHGDYLGDHWLGEKDLFHDASARVPLIIVDPSPEADATRGTVDTRLVELIDLLPTFIEVAGGKIQTQRLEGRSLLSLLRGQQVENWREYAISEISFVGYDAMSILELSPEECSATMIRSDRWKYILHERFRPQLFDMENDPNELNDLGSASEYEQIRKELHDTLFTWFRRRKLRTTISMDDFGTYIFEKNAQAGLFIGYYDPPKD